MYRPWSLTSEKLLQTYQRGVSCLIYFIYFRCSPRFLKFAHRQGIHTFILIVISRICAPSTLDQGKELLPSKLHSSKSLPPTTRTWRGARACFSLLFAMAVLSFRLTLYCMCVPLLQYCLGGRCPSTWQLLVYPLQADASDTSLVFLLPAPLCIPQVAFISGCRAMCWTLLVTQASFWHVFIPPYFASVIMISVQGHNKLLFRSLDAYTIFYYTWKNLLFTFLGQISLSIFLHCTPGASPEI